jgi:hypothetical protein
MMMSVKYKKEIEAERERGRGGEGGEITRNFLVEHL